MQLDENVLPDNMKLEMLDEPFGAFWNSNNIPQAEHALDEPTFSDCTVVFPSMLTPSTPNPGDSVIKRLSNMVEKQCIKSKADCRGYAKKLYQ